MPVLIGGWCGRPCAFALCRVSHANSSGHDPGLKRSSCTWVKTRTRGYGMAKRLSNILDRLSRVEQVRRYIQGQPEHHRKLSFQDELRVLLKPYEMPFDERYMWD